MCSCNLCLGLHWNYIFSVEILPSWWSVFLRVWYQEKWQSPFVPLWWCTFLSFCVETLYFFLFKKHSWHKNYANFRSATWQFAACIHCMTSNQGKHIYPFRYVTFLGYWKHLEILSSPFLWRINTIWLHLTVRQNPGTYTCNLGAITQNQIMFLSLPQFSPIFTTHW